MAKNCYSLYYSCVERAFFSLREVNYVGIKSVGYIKIQLKPTTEISQKVRSKDDLQMCLPTPSIVLYLFRLLVIPYSWLNQYNTF